MALGIDPLRLTVDEMKATHGVPWRIVDAQLVKALNGVAVWLGEHMPMEIVMDLANEFDEALEQAGISEPDTAP